MRKMIRMLMASTAASAAFGWAGAAARASVLFSDSFDSYTAGNLAGQGPWLQVSTQTATLPYDPVQTSGGAVTLTPGDGVNTDGQWVEASIGSTITAGTVTQSVFYAADINITATGSGDYFMDLRNSGSSKSYAAQLWAKSAGSGQYVLGISIASSGLAYGTTDLTLGQTYHVVVQYTLVKGSDDDLAAVYIDPTDTVNEANDTPYATAGASSGDSSGIANIDLREGTEPLSPIAPTSPTLTVDNVVVSNDFTSAAVSVPEPTMISVSALAGIALLARRRRRV